MLFLVYINDLPLCVSSKLRLFADDAYLYRVIYSLSDTEALQGDLDRLQIWENLWSMEFHPDKCKVLTITNKLKPIIANYTIHDQVLESVRDGKYLGVIVHNRLSWKPHITNICAKANQCRIFLQRNLRGCSHSTKAKAYLTYVKPVVMYASTVWNPINNQSLVDCLESVQRKAARFVFSNW